MNAIGGVNHYNYLGSLVASTGPRNREEGTTAQVGLQLKIPPFDGGRVSAQTRQANEKLGVASEQAIPAERVAEASGRGVAANTRALEGIRAQVQGGLRPLLDRLNAEQELLNAATTLVTARGSGRLAGSVVKIVRWSG